MIAEQPLVQLLHECLHAVDRHGGVDALYRLPQQREDGIRADPGPHIKSDAVVAPRGKEDLPMHAFPGTFIQSVSDDSDDFDIQLRSRSIAVANMPSDRGP